MCLKSKQKGQYFRQLVCLKTEHTKVWISDKFGLISDIWISDTCCIPTEAIETLLCDIQPTLDREPFCSRQKVSFTV